ncbi:MAG: nuclear transport factor 2 family protein [Terriglobales bacterium]
MLAFPSFVEVCNETCLSLAVCVVLVFAAVTANAQKAAKASAAEVRQLERLETVWNTAHENGDVHALEALWADDIEVAVPRMAVLTKTDAMSFARSGRMKFLRYATCDVHVRVYGDAAVVTGRLQRTRSMNGKDIFDNWRFTKMYIRQEGNWRVVSFHASDAAEP